jgi:hypothetical protein
VHVVHVWRRLARAVPGLGGPRMGNILGDEAGFQAGAGQHGGGGG